MPRLTRREWLALSASALFGASRPPNIVLIMTDDQGWWEVGIHGNKDIETPVLDHLASESVELTHFHSAPVCAPTRAGLMTGRHYLRTGIYNTRYCGDTMNASEITIAEVLKQRGYRTAVFGKWHLGEYRKYHPDHRGFDEALTFTPGHTERYYYPDRLKYNGRPIQARGYITDLLTDSAIGFVKENRQRPFFVYLPYNVPHEPHIVDDAHYLMYQRKGLPIRDARIYGLVTQCDGNIGRLLKAIDDEGLRDNTIVIFMSDNGGLSKHYNAGLRGLKGSVYEGGTRVPCFIRLPGTFPAGVKLDAMASHLDIFPTLCELTGAKVPQDRTIDGRSLIPLLTGKTKETPHEYLVHIWDRYRPGKNTPWSIAGPRFKLVSGEELYDLPNDPGERNNIAAKYPEMVAKMRSEYDRWFADVTRGQTYQPVPVEIGGEYENPVELLPSWAHIHGTQNNWSHPYAVNVDGKPKTFGKPQSYGDGKPQETTNYTFSAYDWDTIDTWHKAGESALWDIDVATAGEYEVTLIYGCNRSDAGGEFQVTIGSARLKGTVHATLDHYIFEPHVIGRVRLPKGIASVVVQVLSAPGTELMALNKVRLQKIS